MNVLGALEKLNAEIETPEETDDAFLSIVNEVSEVEVEVKVNDEEVAKDEAIADEAEASAEHLVSLTKVIKTYGISRPVMLAADPKQELVAAGISGSYEELEDTPVKDETADEVVENVAKRLKASGGHMRKLYKRMATNLKSWKSSLTRRNKLTSKALKMASKVMEDTEVNDDKLEEVETPAVEQAKFKALALSTTKLVRKLSEADADTDVDEIEKEVEEVPATQRASLKKLGWTKSTLQEAIRMAEEVEKEVADADEPVAKLVNKMEDEATKVEEAGDQGTDETETELRKAMKLQKLARMAVARARFLTGMALRLTQKTCRGNK